MFADNNNNKQLGEREREKEKGEQRQPEKPSKIQTLHIYINYIFI